MRAEQSWRATLGQLQMEMQKAAFDTWVRDAELISYEDGSFIIGVQNAYARDWLHSRLSSKVTRMLTGMMNRSVEVRFVVWHNTQNDFDTTEKTSSYSQITPSTHEDDPRTMQPGDQNTFRNGDIQVVSAENTNLNQRYAFENFVVDQATVSHMLGPLP
jgi:chromosomal replication initiator protein